MGADRVSNLERWTLCAKETVQGNFGLRQANRAREKREEDAEEVLGLPVRDPAARDVHRQKLDLLPVRVPAGLRCVLGNKQPGAPEAEREERAGQMVGQVLRCGSAPCSRTPARQEDHLQGLEARKLRHRQGRPHPPHRLRLCQAAQQS